MENSSLNWHYLLLYLVKATTPKLMLHFKKDMFYRVLTVESLD